MPGPRPCPDRNTPNPTVSGAAAGPDADGDAGDGGGSAEEGSDNGGGAEEEGEDAASEEPPELSEERDGALLRCACLDCWTAPAVVSAPPPQQPLLKTNQCHRHPYAAEVWDVGDGSADGEDEEEEQEGEEEGEESEEEGEEGEEEGEAEVQQPARKQARRAFR